MKNKFYVGVILILLASCCTTFGQLLWKLGTGYMAEGHALFDIGTLIRLGGGCVLYAGGAVLMMVAFRYGEVSLLHPFLSASYVASFVLGYFVFKEEVLNPFKIIGVTLIMAGLVCLAFASKFKKKKEEDKK